MEEQRTHMTHASRATVQVEIELNKKNIELLLLNLEDYS